ncbi:hypothetical protein AGABI2DRAFT_52114, partial [Agaricus bisporus var. bisporus H97]|uniref:hypothetical protein n=1 Tax=Agaricus bisporus var. bisporus (strain H97 / ATCC MYA-4626 / FGSC 10389) TaxID=936046 RepID=UPI00029F7C7B
LSNVCQPATFGFNKEDVLDETYRKAGKLDGDRFAWRFNPSDKSNFANQLAAALFPWETLNSGIRFESYKLNVYGQGSFFKTHKDTPRDENMFGSLVVVLPFKHEGGELLLRHRGRELVFNGQALIDDAPAASVAYVAFFSDVEHEVARVSSGYRVTVTFNLYFDPSRRAPSARISNDSKLEHPFKTELRRVMEDAVIRDAHPVLGFGLEHAYPFEAAIHRMDALKLKGIDAVLIKVFKELGIHYDFFLLYREDEEDLYCP